MEKKTKVKLFYIFTFGVGYLYAKKKAKQIAQTTNTEIKGTQTVDFNISSLIDCLGGKDNILEIDSTISNLKLKLKDINLANLDAIKRLGAKGTLKNLNQLTILFGDNSQAIAKLLKENLNIN